eukprot:CAMPEP_0204905194 /NCGR_PEP_ID=MMETSP1397-20131031/5294_1 /ASSEMBLY_ACC=CAM_ASM_000891 /TAXON_ID=49980 /ORGANISM="Climacostomum Climacostomum virens, Strain Stock W-24" /LENGTH=98 /DNA_ID=CAMNT_0052074063 /DNA_START=222 /DNA_END=515 /DNA_ORIENTATION=-
MKTESNDLKSTCETEEAQPETSIVNSKYFRSPTLLCSLRMPEAPMDSMPLSNDLLCRLSSLRQQLNKLQVVVQALADEEGVPEEPAVHVVRTLLFKTL